MLAVLHLVQRRLRDVDVPALHQLGHLAVEEGQQQGADVSAIDVGIGVVAAQATRAGDEILVTLHREVVHLPVAGRHRLDLRDGQGDQVPIDGLEATVLRIGFGPQQGFAQRRGVGVIPPDGFDPAKVFLGADCDGPVRVARGTGLAPHLTFHAIGLSA